MKSGTKAASEYHNKILEILEAVLYPHVWRLQKERDVNGGRKRVDITGRNDAKSGFFFRLNLIHRVKCPIIFIECKNYTEDPTNPELDQLNGRLNPRRGKFAILVCRKVANRPLMLQRCKDLLHDHQSYVLVLDDVDICKLLELRQAGNEQGWDDFLEERFEELIL